MNTATYSHIELMNPKLEIKYLSLEKSRNRLLDELEGLDDDLLNTAPAADKWSINQILYHLIESERLTAAYMQKKLQQEETLGTAGTANAIKSVLLKLALLSGRKYKAPAVVATVPEKAMLQKLRQQWDTSRYQLEDVLNEIPTHLLSKCLFKHPYAGPLTATQALTFLQDHFVHHERQIQLIRKSLLKHI